LFSSKEQTSVILHANQHCKVGGNHGHKTLKVHKSQRLHLIKYTSLMLRYIDANLYGEQIIV